MLTKGKYSIFVFLSFAFVSLNVSGEDCQTPSGQKGTCIPIYDCPSLFKLLQKRPICEMNALLLKNSLCNFMENNPQICCPSEPTIATTVNPPVMEGSTEATPARMKRISSTLLPDFNSCGINTQIRIYGGNKTDLDEFPWTALLQYQHANGNKVFACGGSLISKRYILTAAHCVSAKKLPYGSTLIGVRLGEHNTSSNPDCIQTLFGKDCAPEPLDFTIEEQIIHERYSTSNEYNDIALLRLNKNVEFSDFVRPICLPLLPQERKKTYVGQKLFAAGWGLTENSTQAGSPIKLKVQLPVQPLSLCNSTYFNLTSGGLTLFKNQMCAGGEKGKDSCKGVSGGPLMGVGYDENGDIHWFAIGVVSYGANPCGIENIPGVYSRVAAYVEWVANKLKP